MSQDFEDTQAPEGAEPTQQAVEPEPITTEAPAATEAPEAPAPVSDVTAAAGVEVTHVVEHRSFGRSSADEPMPVTQRIGG